MKVILLDFDGVLNSEASFRMEARRKTQNIENTLSAVCCSNLQYIFEHDSDVKIVISSTWRKIHTLVQLGNILNSYGVTGKIIGKTPSVMSGDRAHEIKLWLEEMPTDTRVVILDDDSDVLGVKDPRCHIFQTSAKDGLLFKQAEQIAKLFREAK